MSWKEKLKKLVDSKDWKSALELTTKNIADYPNNVEVQIQAIYLLHNVLLEEDYTAFEEAHISSLLKKYFAESYEKFSDNAEYLFFIGKILFIGEWYFGIDDDLKQTEQKLAFKMQEKAFKKEPSNVLYEWAYRFSLDDKLAGYLAKKIFIHEREKIDWLKSKGFPGKYVLDSLKRSMDKYVE